MTTFSTGTKVDKNKKNYTARPSPAAGGGANLNHAPGVQTERGVKRHKGCSI